MVSRPPYCRLGLSSAADDLLKFTRRMNDTKSVSPWFETRWGSYPRAYRQGKHPFLACNVRMAKVTVTLHQKHCCVRAGCYLESVSRRSHPVHFTPSIARRKLGFTRFSSYSTECVASRTPLPPDPRETSEVLTVAKKTKSLGTTQMCLGKAISSVSSAARPGGHGSNAQRFGHDEQPDRMGYSPALQKVLSPRKSASQEETPRVGRGGGGKAYCERSRRL